MDKSHSIFYGKIQFGRKLNKYEFSDLFKIAYSSLRGDEYTVSSNEIEFTGYTETYPEEIKGALVMIAKALKRNGITISGELKEFLVFSHKICADGSFVPASADHKGAVITEEKVRTAAG